MAPLAVDPCSYLNPHHSVGHCPTNRTEPTCPDRELPAREQYPARANTNRHRLERAHNPQVRGSATSGGLPRRANRTRMSPLCPTVVVGLPGTPGSVKTRAYQFFLGVSGLSGTLRNLPEPQNGACYGRCTLSATTRNVLAWRPRPPSCATPGRSSPRPRKPTGAGSTEATTANPMPRSIGSDQALPTPEIKQADRAKPGSHHLRETRGGSDLLTLHAPETQTSRPREVAEAALCHVDCGLGGAWRRSDRLAARR